MQQGLASWTARGVASQRLRFVRVPSDHGRPEDDQRLHADVAAGIDAGETELTDYLRARTRFIDQALVNALDGGSEQVLIVGAGYDGRAWRYARPGVRWFELDHPDTQADKPMTPREPSQPLRVQHPGELDQAAPGSFTQRHHRDRHHGQCEDAVPRMSLVSRMNWRWPISL